MNGVIVLMSGGIDSSVLLAEALKRGTNVAPVYIQFGLRWEKAELHWIRKFLLKVRSPALLPLVQLDCPMRDIYGTHWSTTLRMVPNAVSDDQDVYLPGRNVMLIAKAACWGALKGIGRIQIGILRGNPFADSRPDFFSRLQTVLSEALYHSIAVEAPFRHLTKENVIRLGSGLPLRLTFSCIQPRGFKPCGRCNKCAERKRAFLKAGIA